MSIMVLEDRGLVGVDPLIGRTLGRERGDVRAWRNDTRTHMALRGLGLVPAIHDALAPHVAASAAAWVPNPPSLMDRVMADPVPIIAAAIGGVAVGLIVVKLARRKKAG